MSTTGIVILIIIISIVVGIFRSKSKTPKDESKEAWPFFPKPPVSRPEQILYFRLVKALPEQIVLAQVQLSRILGVKKGHSFKYWYNRINRMSADFVVCNKGVSLSVRRTLEAQRSPNTLAEQMEALNYCAGPRMP